MSDPDPRALESAVAALRRVIANLRKTRAPADLLARTATRPVELHLGVVTASIGAPFFLWLLRRHRSEGAVLLWASA